MVRMNLEKLSSHVSYQVRDRRLRRDMSLTQLGMKIGTAPTVVWQWERGKHLPGALYLCRLADVFGCTVDELLGRTDDD